MRLFNYFVNSRALIIIVIYLSRIYYIHKVIIIINIIINIAIIIINNIGVSFLTGVYSHAYAHTNITCTQHTHIRTCNAPTAYPHTHTQRTQGIHTDTYATGRIPSPYSTTPKCCHAIMCVRVLQDGREGASG